MKRVLIVCNGDPPPSQLFHEIRAKSDLLIGADGGGNIAMDLGSKPDIVIGDLDSFKDNQNPKIQIIHKSSQETNDLEKALDQALQEKATHVDILGATGHRIDQTLKNLSVLKQFNNQFESLKMLDKFGETRLIPSDFREQIPVGTLVSLFPLSGKVSGITTHGLKYPLKNEALENGVRDGSSNEVIDNPVEISYQHGDLLLFIAR